MTTTKRLLLVLTVVLCIAPLGFPQTPVSPAAATPAAAPAPTPKPITDADLANAPVPSADARAKGDPDGSLTGTASDVTVSDPKKGLTIGDLANQVGQNKIAINFVWTLVTGFLVMFMQAGFAIVETGLCRAKNANHTMMMNFMVYGVGMLAYWLIGFTIQMGGVGAVANLGGTPPLNSEFTITLFGKAFGLFGTHGLFLVHKGTYDVSVMVLFLFQMVFMDTTTTIVTGSCCERWKYAAFIVSTMFLAAFTYPIFANWAWGGGSFGAMLYMWLRYGKPDASMSGNGLLAGLVAITAPSGFVNPVASVIIGVFAGVLVCISVEFVDKVLKVDDPVGAISVHGANGLWGVISIGLFADGKSNYGGSWNGVSGSVTGLFYGDNRGQLVGPVIGGGTLLCFVFTPPFVFKLFFDWVVGPRGSSKSQPQGPDLPEMGAL